MANNENKLDPAGKFYDPKGYEDAQAKGWVGAAIATFFLLAGFAVIASGAPLFGFALIIIPAAGVGIWYNIVVEEHEGNVARAKFGMAQDTRRTSGTAAYKAEEISDQIRDIEVMVSEINESAIKTGDIIINGNQNAVVVGSGVIELINGKKENDQELVNALSMVLGHIENTRNADAAKFFDKFAGELAKEKADKTILNALWEATVAAAPTIKHLSEATTKIVSLF